MDRQLSLMEQQFGQFLAEVNSPAALADLKANFLGKKGALGLVLSQLPSMEAEERRRLGQLANQLKQRLEGLLSEKQQLLLAAEIEQQLQSEWIDLTYSKKIKYRELPPGSLHPVSLVQQQLEEIFVSMGFTVLDGPHVEDDFHNFTALNIPLDHPARDMQDTFWFADHQHLLRTHTSAVQVHGMECYRPPLRFVAPGKVFRCEAIDASHEAVFHQMEGMMVDRDVSVAHLIHFMRTLLSEVFAHEVEVRLRPGYFPFVEPGFELDIRCLLCAGKGCSVCKRRGWLELLPCGMIHPNVLRAGKIDPQEYSGFAFGLGLDRLVMMRYQIDDIRHLHSGNLWFLRQFGG